MNRETMRGAVYGEKSSIQCEEDEYRNKENYMQTEWNLREGYNAKGD